VSRRSTPPRASRSSKCGYSLLHAAGHDEGHGDVKRAGAGEVVLELREERVALSGGEQGLGDARLFRVQYRGRRRRGSQVVALRRNHVAHAAARVGHVAVAPRDHVQMQVRHRLSRRRTDIDADVEGVRRPTRPDRVTDGVDRAEEFGSLFGRRVEPARHMPMRNDERMPVGYGKAVPQREDVLRAQEHALVVGIAERAGDRRGLQSGLRGSVMINSPLSPAATQSAHRQAAVGLRAVREKSQIGQRCRNRRVAALSVVVAASRSGKRKTGSLPASITSRRHVDPCGPSERPTRDQATTCASS